LENKEAMEKRDFEHKTARNLTARSLGARATLLLQPGPQPPVFTKKKSIEIKHSSLPRHTTEPQALVVVHPTNGLG